MTRVIRAEGHDKQPWICEGCGTQFAEYVNGCPKCSEKGLHFSVRQAPSVPIRMVQTGTEQHIHQWHHENASGRDICFCGVAKEDTPTALARVPAEGAAQGAVEARKLAEILVGYEPPFNHPWWKAEGKEAIDLEIEWTTEILTNALNSRLVSQQAGDWRREPLRCTCSAGLGGNHEAGCLMLTHPDARPAGAAGGEEQLREALDKLAFDARVDIEWVNDALNHAGEGRRNTIKPDLLGNAINKHFALHVDRIRALAAAPASPAGSEDGK